MVEGGEFERLVTTCYAALVRTAVLLTGDRGHAEDLVQAALVRTYLAWGRLRSTDSAEAYTRTVMARLAIKWGRRRWRGRATRRRLWATPPRPTSSTTPTGPT